MYFFHFYMGRHLLAPVGVAVCRTYMTWCFTASILTCLWVLTGEWQILTVAMNIFICMNQADNWKCCLSRTELRLWRAQGRNQCQMMPLKVRVWGGSMRRPPPLPCLAHSLSFVKHSSSTMSKSDVLECNWSCSGGGICCASICIAHRQMSCQNNGALHLHVLLALLLHYLTRALPQFAVWSVIL